MGKLFLITGTDDFAVKNQAREIAASLCGDPPEENPELEIVRGDSDELKPEGILDALYQAIQTPPFLCAEKKIWLKHFQHFEKVLDSAKKDGDAGGRIDDITALIKAGLPADVTLIIDGPGIDKRKAFFKACKEQGEIFSYDKADLSSKDFARSQFARIQEQGAKAGVNISPDAVSFLAETVGSDSGRLANELEKLCCYVQPRREITLEDCKNVCSRTPEAVSWDFANALTARDIPRALEIIDTLIQQLRNEKSSGNHELSLLRQAVNTFQEMIQTRCAAAELGAPPRPGKNWFYSLAQEIKDRFPANFLIRLHPFRAYMLCESANSFSDRELVEALNALLETNRHLVSGGADSRLALEQLVLRVAGKTRPSRSRNP